jgi:hypothetical protein
VVKGHLVGPSTVELEEPAPENAREVEVILRVGEARPESGGANLAAFLRSLPPGTRSKADIDQQIRDERDSWT